jgi:hypothetical protein
MFERADALLHEALAGGDPRRCDDAANFVFSCRRSGRRARSTRAKSRAWTGCAGDVGRAEGAEGRGLGGASGCLDLRPDDLMDLRKEYP